MWMASVSFVKQRRLSVFTILFALDYTMVSLLIYAYEFSWQDKKRGICQPFASLNNSTIFEFYCTGECSESDVTFWYRCVPISYLVNNTLHRPSMDRMNVLTVMVTRSTVLLFSSFIVFNSFFCLCNNFMRTIGILAIFFYFRFYLCQNLSVSDAGVQGIYWKCHIWWRCTKSQKKTKYLFCYM